MRKMLSWSGPLLVLLGAFSAAAGQNNSHLITDKAAGKVRLGITVSQARKAMQGYRFKRVSDGEGIALIEVLRKSNDVMTLYAGEENPEARINERAKIEQIWVWDSTYRTVDGIHPDMTIKHAERILGKVEKLFMSEIESREFAIFQKKPKGLMFRIEGGIFPPGKRVVKAYERGSKIISVQISPFDSRDF